MRRAKGQRVSHNSLRVEPIIVRAVDFHTSMIALLYITELLPLRWRSLVHCEAKVKLHIIQGDERIYRETGALHCPFLQRLPSHHLSGYQSQFLRSPILQFYRIGSSLCEADSLLTPKKSTVILLANVFHEEWKRHPARKWIAHSKQLQAERNKISP